MDYLLIYDGDSKETDLAAKITGNYNQTKISVPGNQMFITFETTSKLAKKGFKASISKMGTFDTTLLFKNV